MKTLYSLLLVSVFTAAHSQTTIDESKCPDCKIPCMCQLYYNDHLKNADKRTTITRNWNDFFGEDLTKLHDYAAGAEVVNIKFDGLGCIYPESTSELLKIKEDFLGTNEKDYKKFYKHSFYQLYNMQQQGHTNAKIDAFIKSTAVPNDFKPIQRAWRFKIIPNFKKDIEYFEFINAWNTAYLPGKIKEINQKLSGQTYKKVVFFIHGYNVPYSLAVFQGKIVLDKILEADNTLTASDVLLINVYWPSGDRKSADFKDDKACDYSNKENPKTAIAFTYYSNRAYLSAIFIRRILRQIDCTLPIDIITHSHGSAVATTALINTIHKIQNGELSEKIKTLMKSEALPDKEINVFLNAPSIPGVSTFMDVVNSPTESKYRFFVGYNINDEVLKKQKFKLFGHTIKVVSPSGHISSTTLGCNRNDEIKKTLQALSDLKMDFIFKSAINSTQKEHDFFCYVKQTEFKANLKLFLDGSFK